jgi:hypothetical protein
MFEDNPSVLKREDDFYRRILPPAQFAQLYPQKRSVMPYWIAATIVLAVVGAAISIYCGW